MEREREPRETLCDFTTERPLVCAISLLRSGNGKISRLNGRAAAPTVNKGKGINSSEWMSRAAPLCLFYTGCCGGVRVGERLHAWKQVENYYRNRNVQQTVLCQLQHALQRARISSAAASSTSAPSPIRVATRFL